jgi:hypothetical protein
MSDPKRSLSLVQPTTPPPPAFNPYAAPKSAVDWNSGRGSSGRVARDGKVLVFDRNAELPHLCVKCAQPEAARITRKLSWHNPWLGLLVLAGLLVYVAVALIVRKQATVQIGLCTKHLRQRRIGVGLTWGFVGLMFVCFAAGFVGTAFLCILAALVCGLGVARLVWPVRIDEREVRLRGAGEEFLRKLERAA